MSSSQSALQASILSAASQNSELLVQLSKTMDAVSLLRAHTLTLSRLQDSILSQQATLETLSSTVSSTFKSHRKYRDSHTRRFLYRATKMLAKFESKAAAEERAYFAALAQKSKAEERLATLQTELREAEKQQRSLQETAKVHEDTHAAIDALYESLFAGPSPGFPVEDKKENTFYTARKRNKALQEEIRSARRAQRFLNQAGVNARRAGNHLKVAGRQAQDSILFFDDAVGSVGLSNEYVGYALVNISKAEDAVPTLFAQDVVLSAPKTAVLRKLHDVEIQQAGRFSSRDGLLAAISDAQDALETARSNITHLTGLVQEYERAQLQRLKGTARNLEDSRQALQQERLGIFEKVAGFGEAAPSYMECCDRAEAFCEVPVGTTEGAQIDPGDERARTDDVAEGRGLPEYDESAAQGEESVEIAPAVSKEER
jgi:hypothetical protein